MLTNPHIGPNALEPNEVDADALFARLEQRVAELILTGPSTDDDGWFYALLDGAE